MGDKQHKWPQCHKGWECSIGNTLSYLHYMWSGMVLFEVELILDKNVYCNTQSTTKQDF